MFNKTTFFTVTIAILTTGALLNLAREIPGLEDAAKFITKGYGE